MWKLNNKSMEKLSNWTIKDLQEVGKDLYEAIYIMNHFSKSDMINYCKIVNELIKRNKILLWV